ncbi:MAG TPA: RNA methyltransferase [Thermoplasmata archaeon]|nr:RNA methyltransferase [Thermoplasmata archaeon]
MPHIRVVMIEPLKDGNVGAVARAMKNFGLSELVLVRPCSIGEEGIKRSMHAVDILKNARTCFTEGEALEGVDYIVGTSGVDTANDKKFSRISLTPEALAAKLEGSDAVIAILLGREDFGLDNDLVKRCDFLVTIPANPEYNILNISHAAAVIFYELFVNDLVKDGPREASGLEVERLNDYFAKLLDAIDYPEHKKPKTKVMFRRLMARSTPTTWEYHTLMGVLKDAAKGCLQNENKKDAE